MARKVTRQSTAKRKGAKKTSQKRQAKPVARELFEFHGDVELKPHNMIIQMLKVGKPVLVSEMSARLGGIDVLRHVHAIRKIGGYLRHGKEGKNVVTLHLLNHTNYNRYGEPTSKAIEANLIRPETRSETLPYQQAA